MGIRLQHGPHSKRSIIKQLKMSESSEIGGLSEDALRLRLWLRFYAGFTTRLLPISWLFWDTLSHTLSYYQQQFSITGSWIGNGSEMPQLKHYKNVIKCVLHPCLGRGQGQGRLLPKLHKRSELNKIKLDWSPKCLHLTVEVFHFVSCVGIFWLQSQPIGTKKLSKLTNQRAWFILII